MEINILVDSLFQKSISEKWLRSIVSHAVSNQSTKSYIQMSLVITGEEEVRKLNRDYRNIDEPTDVLSFYMIPEVSEVSTSNTFFAQPPDGVSHLGEVIISYPQAVKQAEEHQHPVKKEIAILIAHGVLHLMGHDHNEPEQEIKMKEEERNILDSIREQLE
ncbi:rRNA maturation RNase YbeY [Chloroflexota bacterium]